MASMNRMEIIGYLVTTVAIVFVSLAIITGIIRRKREKRELLAELERERIEKQKRKIKEVVDDMFGNFRDYDVLDKLTAEEKSTSFYREAIYSAADTILNNHLALFFHFEIDFRYLAGVMLWILEFPGLEKRYSIDREGLSRILQGRSYFDITENYHKRIEKIKEIFDRNPNDVIESIREITQAVESIPYYTTDLEHQENLSDYILKVVATSYLQRTGLNKVLSILSDSYFDNPKRAIMLIPAYMIYLAVVKERTEEIIKVEQDLYYLYALFYQPRTEDEELQEEGVLVRETKDLLIVRSLIYMRSGLLEKVDEELKQYLYEISDKDMIDDIQEEFLMLQKFYQEYGMKRQEEMILMAMLDRKMVLSSELEMRLQYLHKGLKNNIHIFNNPNSEESFVFDYRSLNWGRQEITQYLDELTMKQQILMMPLVIDSWEKNITAVGVKWDISIIQESIKQLMELNFENEFTCRIVNAGAATELGSELEQSILITENDKKYCWLAFLITGEQITRSQVSIAIYAVFIPQKLVEQEESKENMNSKILNWLISIKEKQNPKLSSKIQTIQTLLVEKLEQCINQNVGDSIYD